MEEDSEAMEVVVDGEYLEEAVVVGDASQEDLVVKSSIDDVPYFNASMYLENKQQV